MNKKYAFLVAALYITLFLSVVLGLFIGPAALSPSALREAILHPETHKAVYTILTAIRIPRILAAVIGGAGLSLSGVILQHVMDNPLASPNTIGVNAGAGAAAVICLALFPKQFLLLPFAAFFGAFFTCLLIMLLAELSGRGKSSIILAGIACTSLFQALISFITALDSDVLTVYAAFSIGSFAGVSSAQLLIPGIFVCCCIAVSLILSGRIMTLSLGDAAALALGVRVRPLRFLCVILASMSAAAVISYAGLLGFIGLIIPNMARRLVGGNFRSQIVVSVPAAAILLLWTDLVGRTLFAPSEISVGIFTAMLGAPIFFAILLGRRKGVHHA